MFILYSPDMAGFGVDGCVFDYDRIDDAHNLIALGGIEWCNVSVWFVPGTVTQE